MQARNFYNDINKELNLSSIYALKIGRNVILFIIRLIILQFIFSYKLFNSSKIHILSIILSFRLFNLKLECDILNNV